MLMNLKEIYHWFVPRKKLSEMEKEVALQVIYKLILDRAKEIYENKYFRKSTNYYKQNDFDQLVYYNEIATSLLAETKLLLIDYQKTQNESQVYDYIAENLNKCLINTIKSMGVRGNAIVFWRVYLEKKEENICQRIIYMRERAMESGSNFSRALIHMPKNIIVRSSVDLHIIIL